MGRAPIKYVKCQCLNGVASVQCFSSSETRCLVCETGFTRNSNYECVPNVVVPVTIVTTQKPVTTVQSTVASSTPTNTTTETVTTTESEEVIIVTTPEPTTKLAIATTTTIAETTTESNVVATPTAIIINDVSGSAGIGTGTATKTNHIIVIKSTVSSITWSSELKDKNSEQFKKEYQAYCDAWKQKEGDDLISCVV